MIEVKKVSKCYKTKKGKEIKALSNVNISFPDWGMVFITGKSGCGKTTLLNIIGGLDKASEGEVLYNGKTLSGFKNSEIDSYRNTHIGFIFQDFNLINSMSVRDNVALALEMQNKSTDLQQIQGILKAVDLDEAFDQMPEELSGGQKQRVAIARA
jgi:ABC-type lipoprotein export system ATPase subunit